MYKYKPFKYRRIVHKVLPLLLGFTFFLTGCKKMVDIEPPSTSITGPSAYSSNQTAIAVLNGLYSQVIMFSTSSAGSIPSLSFYCGLSADEFSLWNSATNVVHLAYYKNALLANLHGYEFWAKIYPYIFTTNSIVDGLNNSIKLTPAVKQQLLGEAKFMRAFFYFYLVNLYGDVPLVLTTDYTINAVMARTSATQVWQQIISDLKDAEGLLVDGYLKSDCTTLYAANSAERIRPNKYAAAALLARVYLYTKDYSNAELAASRVINNTNFYNLPALNNVFLKNSNEAIWQLQPINTTWNTEDAKAFIYPTSAGPTSSNPILLSLDLLKSFETNDLRKVNGNWVNSVTVLGTTYYYPFKYKVYLANTSVTTPASMTEYYMVLRLGEQYLIRAEARAQLDNIAAAKSDLNMIRTRAGLPNTVASTKASLITAILNERQVELFAELGQRWFDLKRTNSVDSVMINATSAKGGVWQSYQQLYPVFYADILKNANLSQNSGY